MEVDFGVLEKQFFNEREDIEAVLIRLTSLSTDQSKREKFATAGIGSLGHNILVQFLGLSQINKRERERITHLCRILRNLTVNSPLLQTIFRKEEVAAKVIQLLSLSKLDIESTQEEIVLQRVAIQVLGNFVSGNEDNKQYTWMQCYPSVFRTLLSTTDRTAFGYTCMLLYTCGCMDKQRRTTLLSDEEGKEILKALLNGTLVDREVAQDAAFDWIFMIMCRFFEDNVFPEMFKELGYATEPLDTFLHSTNEHVILLKLLDAVLHKPSQVKTELVNSELCTFLVKELDRIYSLSESGNEEEDKLHVTSSDGEALLLLIQIFNTLTEKDQYRELTAQMQSQGLLKIAVALLHRAWKDEKHLETLEPKQKFTFGFKRDLIQIIANTVYHNFNAQNELRELGGIQLLLNHCKIDDANPYAKEWSVLALRNACENNAENQKLIQELKLQGVEQTHVLEELGLQARIQNGRVKISQVDF